MNEDSDASPAGDRTADGDEVVLYGGLRTQAPSCGRGHVLRPADPNSRTIHRALRSLRERGFEGASNPIAIDPDGRERLEFIEGDVPLPPYADWARTDEALASTAVLIRKLHDASAGLDLATGTWSSEMADPKSGPVLRHNDVCLENVVFDGGRAVALIDFDFAAPGRRTFDIAAFARMCVPIDDDAGGRR